MEMVCAWCEAPKQFGNICPQCGADYAKAQAIKNTGKVAPVTPTPLESTAPETVEALEPSIPVRDPAFEKTLCIYALPSMLAIAFLVQVSGFMSGMQRIFFAMPVHELGHAVTGWLCGFNSIPTLWKTITPENRGYLATLFLLAGVVALVRYAIKKKQPVWLAAVMFILLLQGYGTLIITPSKADMYITIGGDAMGMVLATILMALFYVGKDTQLYLGSLRWGFLGIGAAAFINIYAPWWKKNITEIGYGLTGGIPTDSWKMINIHLWDWDTLFTTHIYLGIACLLALVLVYTLGLKQAIGWEREKRRHDRLAQRKRNR
jgi:hypothetical protein